MNKELNIKIAEWLGYKIFYEEWDSEHKSPMFIPSGKPKRTHMIDAIPVPNFTDSMDACIKWIVPAFITKYGKIMFYALLQDIIAHIGLCDDEQVGFDCLPLMLCLAVEKLIDSETTQ